MAISRFHSVQNANPELKSINLSTKWYVRHVDINGAGSVEGLVSRITFLKEMSLVVHSSNSPKRRLEKVKLGRELVSKCWAWSFYQFLFCLRHQLWWPYGQLMGYFTTKHRDAVQIFLSFCSYFWWGFWLLLLESVLIY